MDFLWPQNDESSTNQQMAANTYQTDIRNFFFQIESCKKGEKGKPVSVFSRGSKKVKQAARFCSLLQKFKHRLPIAVTLARKEANLEIQGIALQFTGEMIEESLGTEV